LPLEYSAIFGVEPLAVTEETIIKRSTAYKMLFLEAVIVLLCAFLFFVFANHEFAYSVILGGVAFIFPNAIFAWFSLRTPTAGSTGNKTLAWFFVGEAIKIVATIIVFAAAIILVAEINIGLMFVSYGLVLLINLAGLAILMKN
jgi:ATP synthase protein I